MDITYYTGQPQKFLTDEQKRTILEYLSSKGSGFNPPSIFNTELLSQKDWYEAGKPRHWAIVETSEDYLVLKDVAYNSLLLMKNNEVLAYSNDIIVLPHIMVIDKLSYGTSKYIWE